MTADGRVRRGSCSLADSGNDLPNHVTFFHAGETEVEAVAGKREPFRQSDRDEVTRCLKTQGGLDACHLAFYKEGDLGSDGLWDNWRLEGPSFVWYFRGNPHVHVWDNVAATPKIELNSYQDSVGV